jgi:hypothetical protein
MTLASFKTAAQIITGTLIKQVFFDYLHAANVERDKLYPYVLWDLNSWKGRINWANTGQKKEKVTVKVYVLDYFDRGASSETQTKEQVWDDIRTNFRTYCTVLGTNGYISITNLNDMPYEYYSIGINIDAEIGVCFDVEMNLHC